jgi:excisionase family DNA binding protein
MQERSLLTVAEVAERLSVHKQTVWQLAREGSIPCVRLSDRRLRFNPDDVEQYIERKTYYTPRRVRSR